jgi:formylglycine-generating enzyme required for sulfatase activity
MATTAKARYGIVSLWVLMATVPLSRAQSEEVLQTRYADMLEKLRTELKADLGSSQNEAAAPNVINRAKADEKLVRFVVLNEAIPAGLAAWANGDNNRVRLFEVLLGDTELMMQMLVADGANGGKYGRAMEIYTAIQKASPKASSGVLQRLAVAISLEHAVPNAQRNAEALTEAPRAVDPVKRYLSYEKAYLGGELDPAFDTLDTWNLRFVVDGEEPDEVAAWGREMLRNYRPDHIFNDNYGWRYVNVVPSEVRYGSGDVKFDRPELQFFQNILMNGGVCGRRAFFGRFILRAFGIPTIARPSRGHAALAHWTPGGWVVNLGPHWGGGWTKTIYDRDKDFLASTQARVDQDAYLQVKRAQWIGDVMGEKRVYGESGDKPAFWNALSRKTQRQIIEASKAVTLEALGAELGESNQTVAETVKAAPASAQDKQIVYADNGVISIPAVAYSKPSGGSKEILPMKSFLGGMQVFLPRFSREGLTLLRGGAWRGGADGCTSAARLISSGYGRYNNWGFRAAMSANAETPAKEITLDLGDGVTMEMVYINPGKFVMGGENQNGTKWTGVNVPKHEVTITKGFYLGKYEVTQAQYQQIMGSNPSKGGKGPDNPVDNVSEGDSVEFCGNVSELTGQEVRLPTEAEWEYACRAGSTTTWFFGDDVSVLGDYAWYEKNDGGTSHPVGQKKPNPWGLYDMYGNVCERVSDTYSKDYYAKGPKVDPTGPQQAEKSRMTYEINVPKAGKYALSAKVVTANYDQAIVVSVNGSDSEATLVMPFTQGSWQESEPVVIALKAGANTLGFLRRDPPQYGIALKSFTLTPVK